MQDGIHVASGGEEHHFNGYLLVFLADTPAANCVGGYKESSSAYRKCRSCMITPGEMQMKVFSITYSV